MMRTAFRAPLAACSVLALLALQAQAEQGATDLINEWRNVLGQIG